MARAAAAPTPDDWKLQTLDTIARSDRDVLLALRQAQQDIGRTLRALDGRPGLSAQVRRAQLQLAKRNIQARMATLWRQLGDITAARQLEAVNKLIDLQKQLDVFALAAAGVSDAVALGEAFAESMAATAESGLDRMIARTNGQSYTPLSDRVYKSTTTLNGQIDRLVNSALAQGLSAVQFAAQVRDFVNPATPGGVRYASMRLARTEINNAAHAIAIEQVKDHPWVESMKWHLSGSHPKVDVCNSIASGGPKGDGVYPKGAVPAKPHPLCFCFVTPNMPSDEDFIDNLLAGHYDSYVDRYRAKPNLSLVTAKPAEVAKVPRPKTPRPPKVREPAHAPRPANLAPIKAARVSAASPASAPRALRDVRDLVRVTGPNGERVVQELEFQQQIVPSVMEQLGGVQYITEEEAAILGPDGIAAYSPDDRVIHVGHEIFSPQYARTYEQEVKSGWCTSAGHDHRGDKGVIAHEFGHHVHSFFDKASDAEKLQFWDTVQRELGIAKGIPARQVSNANVNFWIERNAQAIAEKVSQYGTSDYREFLAEVWAEYSTNPQARPEIKAIGQALKDISERRAGGLVEDVSRVSTATERITPSLDASINSGVKSEVRLGGSNSQTSRVEFNNGERGIHKLLNDTGEHGLAVDQGDFEELGSAVGRAMEFDVPEVVRVAEDELFMELKNGTLALDLPDEGRALLAGPDGTKLRFLDLLISNRDRNTGNWLRGLDGVQPIDHAGAFQRWSLPEEVPHWPDSMLQGFARQEADGSFAWIDNELTPHDVRTLTTALGELGPLFEARGRSREFRDMIKRLKEIGKHARGTVNFFA